MEKKERIEEEFELESEEQAFAEYSYITSLISINYSLMADELSRLGDFNQGIAIDLGCGLGDLAIEIAKRYAELKVIGIDISRQAVEKAISLARQYHLNNVDFKLADVHNLPFEDNSVDLVVSQGSIHHWKNASLAFLGIYRILKPGGLVYLADLRRDAPEETVKEVQNNLPEKQARGFINSIRASFTPEELKEMLKQLGINDAEVSGQRFSRQTLIKNMEQLRKITLRSADYQKLSQTVLIRKK